MASSLCSRSAVDLVNGRTVRVELPDQFVVGGGRRLDREALLRWLGIGVQDVSETIPVQMAHGPEALPDRPRPDNDVDVAPEEDLPVIAVDNRVALVDEPPPDSSGCLTSIVMRWIAVGVAAGVAIVILILMLMSGSDGSTEPEATGTAQVEETAAAVLQPATQGLLDARTAEVEQMFTIAGNAAGDTTMTAVGIVDFESGDAQSTVEAEGTSLQTYVSETMYAFDAGSGWVEAAPGELNENEDVLRLGLGAFGIGEALNPLAIAYLADAAEEVEEVADDVFEAVAVLPVEGAGAMPVDNWSRAVVGRPQEELSGFGIRLTVRPSVDNKMTITAIVELDDAIPLLGDDPEAESLRGITLTNRSEFTEVGMPVDLSARDADRQELQAFLRQFF